MDTYQIISLIVSTLSLPTIAGLIWKDIHERAQANSEKTKKEQEQQQKNIIRGAMQEELVPLHKKMEYIADKLEMVSEGTLSTLRNDILRCYYSCVEKGYRTQDDSENFRDMYGAYKKLGGNSFIDEDIVPSFDKIPLQSYLFVHGDNTSTQN